LVLRSRGEGLRELCAGGSHIRPLRPVWPAPAAMRAAFVVFSDRNPSVSRDCRAPVYPSAPAPLHRGWRFK